MLIRAGYELVTHQFWAQTQIRSQMFTAIAQLLTGRARGGVTIPTTLAWVAPPNAHTAATQERVERWNAPLVPPMRANIFLFFSRRTCFPPTGRTSFTPMGRISSFSPIWANELFAHEHFFPMGRTPFPPMGRTPFPPAGRINFYAYGANIFSAWGVNLGTNIVFYASGAKDCDTNLALGHILRARAAPGTSRFGGLVPLPPFFFLIAGNASINYSLYFSLVSPAIITLLTLCWYHQQ